MKLALLHVKVISATWVCGFFFRLGQYFFDINQSARIDEWVEKHHGADPACMGWGSGAPEKGV